MAEMTYYLDCEFDGHNGPLLSIAMIPKTDDESIYIQTRTIAKNLWAIANVIPYMDVEFADTSIVCNIEEVGGYLRKYLQGLKGFKVISDSIVDIKYFCDAFSTDFEGNYFSNDHAQIVFEVHNVTSYPTDTPYRAWAVQHNAWWDAHALKYAMQP
jgi:hypothetical protein